MEDRGLPEAGGDMSLKTIMDAPGTARSTLGGAVGGSDRPRYRQLLGFWCVGCCRVILWVMICWECEP